MAWQYVFPAKRLGLDPRDGVTRRHHLAETALQKAIRDAVRRAGIVKPATCHTFPPQLRHPPPGSGDRYQDDSGTARTP